jgi:hypothetical protein
MGSNKVSGRNRPAARKRTPLRDPIATARSAETAAILRKSTLEDSTRRPRRSLVGDLQSQTRSSIRRADRLVKEWRKEHAQTSTTARPYCPKRKPGPIDWFEDKVYTGLLFVAVALLLYDLAGKTLTPR